MKKILSMLLSVIIVIALSSCGQVVEKFDPNKTQIYVSVYNGGTGTSWIEKLAKEWNSKNDKFEIIIRGKEKFNVENAIAEMQSGITSTSSTIFFTATTGFKPAIEQGLLEDLSDILLMKVDGTDKTIGDKFGISEEYVEGWRMLNSDRNGNGLYALPYADSYVGFVYDHTTFLEYGWLKYAPVSEKDKAQQDGIETRVEGSTLVVTSSSSYYYKEGDILLTAGKDGKYGTYDDGQPETYSEWQDLITKIVEIDQKKAFLWTGAYAEYMDAIFYAALYQIGGEDTYSAILARDSNGKPILLNNDESVVINYENGYLADRAQALTDTIYFLDGIVNNRDAVNEKSYSGQTTHHDAQNAFLIGYLNEITNSETAMLCEGVWWENEARSFFKSLEENGEVSRGYGKRDYRYMLLPNFDNQLSDKSAFAVVDFGCVALAKLGDSEADRAKTEASKDFIAFTLSDENLRRFTVETGVNRPYKYELTKEDLAQMTPFARAAHDIYIDTEHIKIIHNVFYYNPFYYSSNFYGIDWINTTRSLPYANMATCIRSANGASGMIAAFNNRCNATQWSQILEEARSKGYIS